MESKELKGAIGWLVPSYSSNRTATIRSACPTLVCHVMSWLCCAVPRAVCCACAVRAAKFVARKQWMVCGADDMQLRVYNYNTMDKVKAFEAHTDYIR